MKMWSVEPWAVPELLMNLGTILSWGIVIYALGRGMNWLVGKVPDDADVSQGIRDTNDQWLRVRPPQNVRRRPHWKYVGLWFNNLPGSLLVGYAVSTGRWWALILTVANWYWAGREFTHQVALDESAKHEEVHDEP